jgi:signal transduction histidine kinase
MDMTHARILDVLNLDATPVAPPSPPTQLPTTASPELGYAVFLSHEVNNKLAGLLLSLQWIRRQVGADHVDPVAVGRSINRAIRLVHDTANGLQGVLRVGEMHLTGQRANLRPVNLYKLVCQSMLQFRVQARRKGIIVRCDVPADALVASHPDVLALALQNLIGNAIKYTPAGSVHITARRGDDGRWQLSVTDDGPGIAPGQLPHLFKAFHRGETHGQCGAGLGLAIAAEAAALVGAELSVHSRPGHGATFRFVFPSVTETEGPLAE